MPTDDAAGKGKLDDGDRPQNLTLANWTDFDIDDLSDDAADRAWNRYAVLKQAEINSMLETLPFLAIRSRCGTLSSAKSDGGTDPLPDHVK